MISPVLGRTSALAAAATRYCSLQATYISGLGTTDAIASQVMAASGVMQNLRLKMSSQPGIGTNYTFTVMLNNVATSMVIVISDAATTGSDLTHTVTYNAGDTLSLRAVPTGPPAALSIIGLQWEQSQPGQTLMGGSVSTAGTGVANYLPLQGADVSSTSFGSLGTIIPTAGTISALYLKLSANPGAAKSYTLTLVKNGVDTALTCTATNATTANDTTHSVSVVAGDYVYWRIDPSGTPTAAAPSVSCLWTPTTDGEALITYFNTGLVFPASTAQYFGVGGGSGNSSTVEANREHTIGSVVTLKKLYAVAITAPTGAQTYTVAARKAGASSGIACVLDSGHQSNSDTTNTATTAIGDLLGFGVTGANTPPSSGGGVSCVAYIVPVNNNTGSFFGFM